MYGSFAVCAAQDDILVTLSSASSRVGWARRCARCGKSEALPGCHSEPRRRSRNPLPKHDGRSVGRGSLDFARDDTYLAVPIRRSSSMYGSFAVCAAQDDTRGTLSSASSRVSRRASSSLFSYVRQSIGVILRRGDAEGPVDRARYTVECDQAGRREDAGIHVVKAPSEMGAKVREVWKK